jgi:membrane associated rhomboid family serine protease
VLPLKDVIPPKTAPIVTFTLLAAGAALVAAGQWTAVPGLPPLPLAILNLAYTWWFAENVEDRLGRWPFAAFYIVCTAAGAVAQSFVPGAGPLALVVSSGATAGVLGAYLVLFRGSRVLVFFPIAPVLHEVPALLFVGTFPLFGAPFGVGVLASIAAGFVTGTLLCLAIRRPVIW